MTRDESMAILTVESDHAKVFSELSGAGRIVLLINPNNGYSVHRPKSLSDRWIAAGWEPVAEFENGEQVKVHRFHLHLK